MISSEKSWRSISWFLSRRIWWFDRQWILCGRLDRASLEDRSSILSSSDGRSKERSLFARCCCILPGRCRTRSGCLLAVLKNYILIEKARNRKITWIAKFMSSTQKCSSHFFLDFPSFITCLSHLQLFLFQVHFDLYHFLFQFFKDPLRFFLLPFSIKFIFSGFVEPFCNIFLAFILN